MLQATRRRCYIRTMRCLSITVLVAACSGGGSSSSSTIPVDPVPDRVGQEKQPPVTSNPKRPWPETRKDAIREKVQGVDISDPYRWLEDEKSPDVQAWMKAQDDHARGELAKLPARAELADRLKALFYYDSLYPPTPKKGRLFYWRKHADKEKKVVYWKQGENGKEFHGRTFSGGNLNARRHTTPSALRRVSAKLSRRIFSNATRWS